MGVRSWSRFSTGSPEQSIGVYRVKFLTAAPDFQLALQTKDKIDKKIDKTRKLLKFNLGERKEKEKLIKGYKKHPDKYKPYDEPIGKALDTDLKKIKTNVFNYKDKKFDIKDKLKVIFQKRNVI